MAINAGNLILILMVIGFTGVVFADFGFWSWLQDRFRVPERVEWQQGTTSEDTASDAPSADQVYLVVAERLLDTQVATNSALDTKTAGAVAVGSTVLPLTFGLLSLSGRTLPGATQWLLVAAVVAFLVLLALAARTSYIRAIEYRPDLRTLSQHSQKNDGATLRRWVAEEYAVSTEINHLVLGYKAQWVGRVTLMLYAEGVPISAAAAVALMG